MMSGIRKSKYLRSALRIALGAGSVLSSAFVLSRIREKQSTEARLERLEQMVEKLAASEEEAHKSRSPDAL